MKDARTMRALLVDPSLFTAPYDAALTEGLVAAGVHPRWAVRPTRRGDRAEIAPEYVDAFFYRHVDELDWLPRKLRAAAKGCAHVVGLIDLARRVLVQRPDVVHFQWTVVPVLDSLTMLLLKRVCPVVLTVHDTRAFNGDYFSFLQSFAVDAPMRLADRVIVHTQAGRDLLVRRGLASEKISVIPHGPLVLRAEPSAAANAPLTERRWTFLLFGEIKRYKGLDVLIEAVHLLPGPLRQRARFVVAGLPRIDLAPLRARIAELGLEQLFDLRPRRFSEQEMADLFAQSDCVLFPYRQIDASGVYFLVKPLSKWMIASRIGVFAEDLEEGAEGALVTPEDPAALAEAIARAILEQPKPTATKAGAAWITIGRATLETYRRAQAGRRDAALFSRWKLY